MSCYALLAAAGNGFRFGGGIPKQYSLLNGKPVLQHSIERLASGLALSTIYVVLARDDHWFDDLIPAHLGVTALRCGGESRAASISNALHSLAQIAGDDWIVVHDAVRPCVDPASVSRLRSELVDDRVGGILAIPVTGTLKSDVDDGRAVRTEDPEGLWRAQTPQMFRYGVLRDAFARPGAEASPDEAHAVSALGLRPRLVPGTATNIKITYVEDLILASAILSAERS